MSARRRKAPETRRNELIASAQKVFIDKGVAATAVSDIVKAAGVAQGTFYLYFAGKDELVNAVAEAMVERMVGKIEAATADGDAGAVAKIMALRAAILAPIGEAANRELAEIYHRPENRAVHDRMAERMTARLASLVERIVVEGVAEGVFTVEDTRVAAWFVVGGLRMIDVGFTETADLPAAIGNAMACALRALGTTPATAERLS